MSKRSNARKTIHYSESFKIELIRRLESEDLSIRAISKLYGISGSETVKRWLKKYGREHLLSKKVIVMSLKDQDAVKRLEQENKALRDLVVRLQLESLANESLAEIACEQLGIDKDALKKKQAQK